MNEAHQLGSEGAEDLGLVGKQCFGVFQVQVSGTGKCIIKTHFTTLIDNMVV